MKDLVSCWVVPAITAVSKPNSSPPRAPTMVLFKRYEVIAIYGVSPLIERSITSPRNPLGSKVLPCKRRVYRILPVARYVAPTGCAGCP